MSFQLVMKSAPYPEKEFPLVKDEMIVGRDTTSDIVISDAEISRRHARLYKLGEAYMIEDLGSTNGSFVNGQRLTGPHALQPGETVRFGENIMLVFEAPMAAYDPNATMVSGGSAFPMPGEPVAPAIPPMSVPAVPDTAGKVGSPGEPAMGPVTTQKKSNRNMIIAGVGCLVLLCCACLIAVAYYADSMHYWGLLGG